MASKSSKIDHEIEEIEKNLAILRQALRVPTERFMLHLCEQTPCHSLLFWISHRLCENDFLIRSQSHHLC